VTILERDDTPMPPDPDAAFAWERTGAPQVRHSHAFLARLRNLLRDRAPDVLDALLAAGAYEIPFMENLPPTLTDRTPRPGDEDLVALACRRTTFEWVLRRLVLAEPHVELRHGIAAKSLDGANGMATGVDGLAADLVVDARGPRSNSDDWLEGIGAPPAAEELHESGIVYFSRFYRLATGAARPDYVGPTAADLGYLKYAIFLGDRDTFSITYAVEHDDRELRKALVETEAFEHVAGSIFAIAPWRADGMSQPITDVHIMAGLRNRYRQIKARGFTAVGDAAVCTNPLYGRGCSLALVHAFALADTLPDLDAFHDATERELVPWFRSAVMQDAQARAMNEELPAEDPRSFMQSVFREGLLPAMRTSPVVFRAFVRWFNLLVTPETLMADNEVIADVMAAYQDRDNHPAPPPLGPSRQELVAALPGQ
jgi:2-polyprenyl-6-methoxyphenol hydroxylase-like FAD-dependent oxidoreductase